MIIRKILILLLLFISGCSASLSSYEQGLWFDDDKRGDRKIGFGIKADIVQGQMVRPISFSGNTWNDPDFAFKSPIIAPFFSIAYNELGFYIGFKSFKNYYKGRYDWLSSDADPNNPEILFTPSASIRRTRVK